MSDREHVVSDRNPFGGETFSACASGGAPAKRGFAAMDPKRQREIASKGGHSQGKENNRGNFWHDRERARIAGRKGGEAHGKNRLQPTADTDQRH